MEKEFREITGALKEAERSGFINGFALTGALALSALTEPRATNDIDFIISVEKEKIPFLVDWFISSKGYNLTKHHVGRPKDHIKDLIEVPMGGTSSDLLVISHDVEREALARGITIIAFNVRLKVVRPEYLIVLKLIAGSEQDFIDSAHLWNEPVDKRLVRKLAKGLYLEGKLKKMLRIAGKI